MGRSQALANDRCAASYEAAKLRRDRTGLTGRSRCKPVLGQFGRAGAPYRRQTPHHQRATLLARPYGAPHNPGAPLHASLQAKFASSALKQSASSSTFHSNPSSQKLAQALHC